MYMYKCIWQRFNNSWFKQHVCCVTQQTCLLSCVGSWAPVDRPQWVNLGHPQGNGGLFRTMD